jgi:hypothetical protein
MSSEGLRVRMFYFRKWWTNIDLRYIFWARVILLSVHICLFLVHLTILSVTQSVKCVATNDWMIVNNDLEIVWKETVVA